MVLWFNYFLLQIHDDELYIHFKSAAGLTAIIVWNQQMVLGFQKNPKQCKAEG